MSSSSSSSSLSSSSSSSSSPILKSPENMSIAHSAWSPKWGAIPPQHRRNMHALAMYCYENPSVLDPPEVLATVCQFLLPRIGFPHALKNYDALMEYIGLGYDANIDEIQADPLKALRVIVNFGTCPPSMWTTSNDPCSACCDWPGELAEVRLLARAVARRAAE